MQSTTLALAYAALQRAVDEVIATPVTSHAVRREEWDAEQQLAHLIAVDAGVLAVASSVASGGHATFDNRLSLDTLNLARISRRCGGSEHMGTRVLAQGRALCQVVDELSEEELGQPIPTFLVSGTTVVVDQPVSLGDLVSGIAEDHLPRHTRQLLALLPT